MRKEVGAGGRLDIFLDSVHSMTNCTRNFGTIDVHSARNQPNQPKGFNPINSFFDIYICQSERA